MMTATAILVIFFIAYFDLLAILDKETRIVAQLLLVCDNKTALDKDFMTLLVRSYCSICKLMLDGWDDAHEFIRCGGAHHGIPNL